MSRFAGELPKISFNLKISIYLIELPQELASLFKGCTGKLLEGE
jgi:hypothetical protein